MKSELIFIAILAVLIIGVVLGDQQTQIDALRVDTKNLKAAIKEQSVRQSTDKGKLWEKWYELDSRIK